MPELLESSNFEERLTLAVLHADSGLTAQAAFSGCIWQISIFLAREDSVWLSIATASSETASDTELRSLRYGPDPEQAVRETLCTLRDSIAAFEQRRKK